ncbi:transposable element Tcb2 transposase [Trichonephila clavipes]|nr:transposable element Tcb2 transposase [Trichonephila clavipes]
MVSPLEKLSPPLIDLNLWKGRIISLREGGFSYHAIRAFVQRNNSTAIRVWKQWTNEHRTTRKTGIGRRKMMSERDDLHLFSSLTSVASWIACKGESYFNLWDHDGRIRVKRYAGERYLPECVIERYSGLTPGITDLVGQRLVRDPSPVASKDELLLRRQAIWNFLPQADIQNLFDSMPRRIAALISSRGGYTKF